MSGCGPGASGSVCSLVRETFSWLEAWTRNVEASIIKHSSLGLVAWSEKKEGNMIRLFKTRAQTVSKFALLYTHPLFPFKNENKSSELPCRILNCSKSTKKRVNFNEIKKWEFFFREDSSHLVSMGFFCSKAFELLFGQLVVG